MQFDWALAIERNRRDLLRILHDLFALAGLDFDAAPAAAGHDPASGPHEAAEADAASFAVPSVLPAILPRFAVLHIRRILRSAEAAVRRLIVIAARDVEVTVRHAPALKVNKGCDAGEARPSFSPGETLRATNAPCGGVAGHGAATPVTVTIRPEPPAPTEKPAASAPQLVRVPVNLGLANLRIIPDHEPEEEEKPDGPVPLGHVPAFPLVDPRKRFDYLHPRRRYARTRPRIRLLGDNPLPVYMRQPPLPEHGLALPGDPVPAATLLRRLIAVRRALDNLDREARRLARHEARVRHRPPDSRRVIYTVLRPGPPPGYRKRNRHAIDEVLKECHRVAVWAEREGPP
ncbi:hypothetical protein [Oricola thermophila]|uniref:Uncharacterized protein n=1 Tax=Oricola thermophila TaxID=2742145 RepID=A0A6N1VBQ9_9HYPH|nr:hypothetical protein [Oricola thermophila]QKV18451.1 hypothetical protein HTY61_08295 [Oricola thermophila]